MVRTKFSIERCRRAFIEVTFCWYSPLILSDISTPNQENYLFVHRTSLNHCAKRKKTKHLCRRLLITKIKFLRSHVPVFEKFPASQQASFALLMRCTAAAVAWKFPCVRWWIVTVTIRWCCITCEPRGWTTLVGTKLSQVEVTPPEVIRS